MIFELVQYQDGTWGVRREPYATIECATEKDLNALLDAAKMRWIRTEDIR